MLATKLEGLCNSETYAVPTVYVNLHKMTNSYHIDRSVADGGAHVTALLGYLATLVKPW